MKATEPKPHLEERFIIPIARELALALSHVHEAGVIHRDIKCGNVLISEDGQLQLCDFGVAAIIENDVSKRSTIIGTPYWMAPEMHADAESAYGTEIDCWAFGCTVFEMATGMPPYHTFAPAFLRQVLKSVPRLKDGQHSKELCDFVAFCLQAKPEDRPTAKQILTHPYIHDTSIQYPTDSLRELIDRYILWERKGGQRMSLFNAHGAAAPQMPGEQQVNDSWIFSTTVQFEKDYQRRHSRAPSITAMDFRSDDFDDDESGRDASPMSMKSPPRHGRGMTPYEKAQEEARAKRGEKSIQRLFQLESDPYDYDTTGPEESPRRLSDLPLRNLQGDRAANRETLIDLDTGALDMTGPPTFNFEIGDVPTMKANRQSMTEEDDDDDNPPYQNFTQHTRRPTRDWKFPSFDLPPEGDHDVETKRATKDWKFPTSRSEEAIPDVVHTANRRTMDWTFNTAEHVDELEPEPEFAFPSMRDSSLKGPPPNLEFRPGLQRTATEPVGQFNDFMHPPPGSLDADKVISRESTAMIDLDLGGVHEPRLGMEQAEFTRSTTPLSMANSMVSVGPFGFDQEAGRPSSNHTRDDSDFSSIKYSHRRQQKSSVSHIVAQQRISRSLHDRRQYSQGSNGPPGSGSFGGSNRVRTNSVDSTASSTADEQSSWETNGRDYNRYMGAKMRDQLRIGLQRTASQPGRPPQRLAADTYEDNDSEPYRADPYSATSTHGGSTATTATVPSIALGVPGAGFDTDTTSSSFPHFARVPRASRPALAFPEIALPDRGALSESAHKEAMYAEVDKMFGAAEDALGYAVDIFRRRELESAEDYANSAGGSGNMPFSRQGHGHTESESEHRAFATTSEDDEGTLEAF